MVAVPCLLLALLGGGYGTGVTAGVAIGTWALALAGLALGFFPRASIGRAGLVAASFLVALAILTAVSAGWAGDAGRAVTAAPRVAAYAGVFVLVLLAASGESARTVLTGLTLGLAAVGLIALASRLHPPLAGDRALIEFLPDSRSRLSFPLSYWNGLAAATALSLVLCAWQAGSARTRVGRSLSAGAVPGLGLTLYLTSSRGGLVALAVGLVVLVVLEPRRLGLLTRLVAGGAGAAVVISMADARQAVVDGAAGSAATTQGHELLLMVIATALLVAGACWLLDPGVERIRVERIRVPRPVWAALGALGLVAAVVSVAVIDPGKRLDDFRTPPTGVQTQRDFVARHLASAEGSGRYQLWQAGLSAFADRPFAGIGAGGYKAWWTRERPIALEVENAHSFAVETLAELGLLGGILLAGFAVAVLVGGLMARARAPSAAAGGLAVVACGLVSAAIDWTWQLPAVFAPVIVAAAVVTGPALAPSLGRRPGFGWGVATLVVGWAAIILAATVSIGKDRIGASRAAVRAGDLTAAAGYAKDAEAVQPWSAGPRFQLALVQERAGDLRSARRSLDEALERAPEDWSLWFLAVRIDTRAGDRPQAARDLTRARRLNPRSDLLRAPDRPRSGSLQSPRGGRGQSNYGREEPGADGPSTGAVLVAP